jgi:transglutaminase-like putative cysteine protease
MRRQPFLTCRQRRIVGFKLIPVLACLLSHLGSATLLTAQPTEASAHKPPTIVADLWSTYKMGGNPVGYVRETLARTEAGTTYTTIEVVIVINRLGNKVEIKGKMRHDETKEHQLSRIQAETTSSQQKTSIEAEVGASELTIRTRTGAKDYARKIPLTEQLEGPEGARHLCLQKLKDKGDVVSYRSFVPELDGVIQITRKVLAREMLEVAGRQTPALKIEEVVEKLPGKRTVWLDQEGRVLRQIEAGPLGQTEVNRSDRVTALAAAGGNELPAEMYDQTLVRSNIRLPSPRSTSRVLLRLTQKESSLGWPDFAAMGQRVVAKEGSLLVLEIAQVKQGGGGTRPVALTPKLREFLEPNAIIQADDAEVLRIARQVVGDEKDIAKAAGKLRSWVSANMKLDLGIAVAPASEVARNLRGTCMAYSVLLASLLRAAEIPSRIDMGYVYVSGIWGGHAWVEFWAGDRWLPLDAAVPSAGPYDAARLACMKDSLKNGIGPHMGSLLQLYGNVEIDILEFDIDGRSTKVPAKAKPFTIDGDVYRNPWLGVEIVKPANFRFAKMNAVWPDSAILELQGPEKQVIRVLQEGSFGGQVDHDECRRILTRLQIKGKESKQQIAGRDAVVITSPRKAALALSVGSDVWVVTVEADDAATVLSEFSAKLKLSR